MSITLAPAAIQRVRHEIVRRDLVVTQVEIVSPNVRRISLGGAQLAGFCSLGFDDHIKLIWPGEGEQVIMREYTPRHYDAERGQLVLEFVLHQHGIATDWAMQAYPGVSLKIAGPRSSTIIPDTYDWQLLIGDETALPAIARRLQELPASSKVMVFAKTADARDQRHFDSAARFEVQWFADDADLLAALKNLTLPAGQGFVWAAGEHHCIQALQAILRDEKGHSSEHLRCSAYWRKEAS